MRKGNVFVISAPSGAGKSTICHRVLDILDNITFSISMTTRPIRKGEVDGIDYKFVTKEKFKELIEKDNFLEWAKVHNNYYGTPLSMVKEKTKQGVDVILDIDVQGGVQVTDKVPESILIFIAPPSMDELEKRLRGRATDSEETIKLRLNNAKKEMEYQDKYQYIIVNDNLDNAVSEVINIITEYRNKQ